MGTAAGFIKLRLKATSSNAEAIGATVLVSAGSRDTAQVLSRGAGFLSCQAPELIFGLGGAEAGEVSVRWPSGELESFGSLASGTRAMLVEGSGEAQTMAARTTQLPNPLPRGFRVNLGDQLPALAVLDSKGEEAVIDLQELAEGEELYLNFWASYCASCIKELPDLQKLDEEDGRRVIALSMDAPTDLYAAQELFEQRGARFPSYFLGSKHTGESGPSTVQQIIDIERLPMPSTVVINSEGGTQRIISGPLRQP